MDIRHILNHKYRNLILLLLILTIGAFLRFYRISEYMAFLGDEGRDVLVVKRMIVDHQFTLLGPITSVGSVYMGPVYYYFMVPFLWAFNLNPVGPAVMVAFFSLATIFLLYRFGEEFFHTNVGIIASFFYAISPLTILYGRSSWNPNVVPFFGILLMYALCKACVGRRQKWLLIAGLSLGILIQLHYITFVFIPIILTILFLYRSRVTRKMVILGAVCTMLSYSPFLLFEIRHGFVNIHGISRFFLEGKNSSHVPIISSFVGTFFDVFVRVFWRTLFVYGASWAKLGILAIFAVFLSQKRFIRGTRTFSESLGLLLIWLFVGFGFLSIYRGLIYDYYLSSFYPLPFLLFGIALYLFIRRGRIRKGFTALVVFLLIIGAATKSPLAIEPNNLMANTREVSQFIYDRTGSKPYNFALIALGNSDHAYRYFLEVWKNPPVVIQNPVIDPLRESVTDDLYVICEEKVCQPLGHSLWEIAGFGPAEIAGEWKVSTARVFHLVHFREHEI